MSSATPDSVQVSASIQSADLSSNHNAVLVVSKDLQSRPAEQNARPSRPPSRVSGIEDSARAADSLNPSSADSLINALKKIYEHQEKTRLIGTDYIEEPDSPEYSILHALDDSCLLFAVKEN